MHLYKPQSDAHAYYSGSLEAINFGEAAAFPPRADDRYAHHAAIDVRLVAGKPPALTSLLNADARPVLDLAPVDATDLDAVTLLDEIRARFPASLPPEALIRLQIENCPALTWENIDRAALDELGRSFRLCRIEPRVVRPDVMLNMDGETQVSLDDQWKEYVEQVVPDQEDRTWYIEQGLGHIVGSRQRLEGERLHAGGA